MLQDLLLILKIIKRTYIAHKKRKVSSIKLLCILAMFTTINLRIKLHLYKFREVNTNNLSALANSQFWFSGLNDFNDPFEGSYIKKITIDKKLISGFEFKIKAEVGKDKFKEILNKLELVEGNYTNEEFFQIVAEHDLKKLINIVHSSKIACFSIEKEINNPLTNNLMWSHYANGLRGYCLVFDGDELLNDFYSSGREAIRPIFVKYQNTPNTLKLNDFIQSELPIKDVDINFVQKVTETVATKSSDWEYENEFRLITLDQSDFHIYSPILLKEIIVGDKMPASQKNLLLNVAKASNPNVVVKTAKLKKDSYQIEIV